MGKKLKNGSLITDFHFSEIEPLENNPMVSRVKIRIAEPDKITNRLLIRKNVLLEGARKTLGMTPIVGYFSEESGDFGSHGHQVESVPGQDEVRIVNTQAFGAIPEKPEIFWEKGYLSTYGYLWTERFPFLAKAMGEKGKSQSMELDGSRTVLGETYKNGTTEISTVAFKGLCILGDTVPPAFSDANIEISDGVDTGSINYSLDELQKQDTQAILFSAMENQTPDFLLENLTREQLEGYIKRITETIDSLDEVSTESESEENVEIIDNIISRLVAIEHELKGEPKLTPLSGRAVEALKGDITDEDGVVTTDYNKKEDIEMDEKEKKKKFPPVKEEEEVVEKETVEKTESEPVEQKEEVATEEAGTETDAPEAPVPAEEEVGDDTKGKPAVKEEGMGESQVEGSGEEVPTKEKRKGAGFERAKIATNDSSTQDLLEVLVERLGESKKAQAILIEALDINVSNGSEGQPEDATPVDINEVEATDTIAEEAPQTKTEAPTQTPEEQNSTSLGEDEAEKTNEPEEKVEDEQVSEEPEKEETEGETEETEEEIEKKKRIFTKLESEAGKMLQANMEMEKELADLRTFKLEVERGEKEKVLLEFALSEDSKGKIMQSIDSLELQQVREKAAFLYYEESQRKNGQIEKGGSLETTFTLRDELNDSSLLRNNLIHALKKYKEK